jgi:hypothetical protein
MAKNKSIPLYEKLPEAFFFFQFDLVTKTFAVFINKECIPNLTELAANNRLLPIYKEKFPGRPYIATFERFHGFNSCGEVEGIFGNFLKLSFRLAPMYTITKRKCEDCKGTGKNKDYPYYKWDCYSCHGLGKELESDWTSLKAVINTLSLLLRLLDAYDAIYLEEDGRKGYEVFEEKYKQQMYVLKTCVDGEMNGHALGGSGSGFLKKKVAEYFAREKKANKSYEQIGGPYVAFEKAFSMMREAYKFLSVKPKLKDRAMGFDHISAVCQKDGHFHLQTEGTNSCSLYADHRGMHSWFKGSEEEQGYPLHCHNVDTSFQQMILLIGLAGITEEVLS